MPKGRMWTDRELDKAARLRASGLSFEDIGRTIGRVPAGVSTALKRYRPSAKPPRLRDRPLGETFEDRRMVDDAVIGSARLLEAIWAAFPERRAA